MNTSDNPPPLNLLVRTPEALDTLYAVSQSLHHAANFCYYYYYCTPDTPSEKTGFAGFHTDLQHAIQALDYATKCLEGEREEEAEDPDQSDQKSQKVRKGRQRKGRGGK